jgi:uncharacterized membrane protein
MTNSLVRWLEGLTARTTLLEARIAKAEHALHIPSPPEAGFDVDLDFAQTEPPPLPAPTRVAPVPASKILHEVPAPFTLAPVTPPAPSNWGSLRNQARIEKQNEAALESLIGRNWTSWIGAIVVVLGVLFFLKYAWDQGWLAFAPATRVACAIGTGIVFALAGEWTRRRGMRVLAGTLAGAGVCIVMAAFLAGYSLFDQPVFSAQVAAGGVCIAAGGGIFLALRMNVMTLAIIALLGAYLSPAILQSGRDESLVLMAYLAALAVTGWSLSYLRPRWTVLRWFTWSCTVLWMTLWFFAYPAEGHHQRLALGAVAFFFAGFIIEAVFTLRRAFRIRHEASEKLPGFVGWLENSLALLSMLSTAAAFIACFALLHDPGVDSGLFQLDPAAAVALGLACLHVGLAQATPSRQFARGSFLQAAALVTLAIPLACGHFAITAGWLVLSLAMAALARKRPSPAIRVWSIAVLGLVLLRLFTFDLMDAPLCTAFMTIGQQGVSGWLLMAFLTALSVHVMAWLCGGDVPISATAMASANSPSNAEIGTVLAAIGSAVFFAAAVICWSGAALTLLCLTGAAALTALARTQRGMRLAYAQNAAITLFIITLKWVAMDGMREVAENWNQPVTFAMPLLNLTASAGAAIITLAWLLRKSLPQDAQPIVPLGIAVVAFTLANIETLRAVDYFGGRLADFAMPKLVMLSVVWALVGLACVIVGFARDLRLLRYAALVLLAVTLAKILLVDLAQAPSVYRILSFLAVGVLLLCVSFVYHRHENLHELAASGAGTED